MKKKSLVSIIKLQRSQKRAYYRPRQSRHNNNFIFIPRGNANQVSSDSSRSISVHELDELQGEFCKRAKPREAVQNDDQTKKEEAKVLFFGVDDEDI